MPCGMLRINDRRNPRPSDGFAGAIGPGGGSEGAAEAPSDGQRSVAESAGAALIDGGALSSLDEAVDLLVREPGEPPRFRGDRDRHRVVVAGLPDTAEVEPLVDRVLELDRAPPPLGIARRQLVEPPGSHAH